MAKNSEKEVKDYRHDKSKRKNNPPQASLDKGEPPILPNRNTPIIRTCPRYYVPIHTGMQTNFLNYCKKHSSNRLRQKKRR